MGMLQRVRSLWTGERKESRTTGTLVLNIGQPVWTPRDYANSAKYGYTLNTDVYTCIALIASSAKQIRLNVVQSDGETAVSANNPLSKLVRRPNPRTPISDWIVEAIGFKLISGNRYIERVNEGSGDQPNQRPLELWNVRPDRMKVLAGPADNPVAGYRYTGPNGKKEDFDPWQILHQKSFHPLDDYYGMSPMEAAGYPIDIANACADLFNRLLKQGTPAGWIKTDGSDWSETQIADFKSQLKARSERNEWLVAEGIESINPIGFNPENARILEGRISSKRDVAAAFRVPPEMIGDSTSKTFSNYREARKSLYTEAVIPELQELLDGLNMWLGPTCDGAMVVMDKDTIDALSEDRDTTASRAVKIFEAGLVRRNEARAELGFDPVPEAENVYYQDLPKPASNASQPAQDAPTTAKGWDVSPARFIELNFKSFNLQGDEAKELHWKAVELNREQFYSKWEERIKTLFAAEHDAVISGFLHHREPGAINAVDVSSERWKTLLQELYRDVATDFGRRTLNDLGKSMTAGTETKALDIFTSTVLNWLLTSGAQKVVQVTNTTKQEIRQALAEGVANGESVDKLSKRLTDVYSGFSTLRAERIARTEVIAASNLGSQTAAKATGLKLRKEWISTFDKRTREWHAVAHGQDRVLDQPYDVHGEKLMYPGDTSLGASGNNVIHCRCTESYRSL